MKTFIAALLTWHLATYSSGSASAEKNMPWSHMDTEPVHTTMSSLSTITTFSMTPAKLSVGPGKQFSSPCQALAVAADGALIEIDASVSYVGDVCAFSANHLTIRGINGRPKIDAGGRSAQGKGIWVVKGDRTVIENVEMCGTSVPHKNGAAIRLEGIGLTLRKSYIHDNEIGILTNNDGVSDILIENTEFDHTGRIGGSHNVYIGLVNSLTFRYNYSHDASEKHLLKSRAKLNVITYNLFSTTLADKTGAVARGAPSYEIDLPNGGRSFVIGNIIQQPSVNENFAFIAYGMEGATNPEQNLYVINNTFLNDDIVGTFVQIGSDVQTPALIQNNVFAGWGRITNQSSAIQKTNYHSTAPSFVNRRDYNFRPKPGALFINSGSTVSGLGTSVSLVPKMQYVHPASAEPRPVRGPIDIGAYEAP